MPTQNGLEYAHNYDVMVKWFAEALRGQTLEVLGIPTGRIIDVFGCEHAEIQVNLDRVDVMLRDDRDAVFHLEEQRNLRREDLYRFASYHFQAAQRWGTNVTDILLLSGEILAGPLKITTYSGHYTPYIVDFTVRDGPQRLQEIRAAVAAGTFTHWLELIFLPIYGKTTEPERSAFIEQVVHFEKELYQACQISSQLLAATLIMSNKLVARERLYELWEEIKMLDILEIAREKGIEEGKTLGLQEGKTLGLQEGKTLGLQEGKTLGLQDVLIDTLQENCGLAASALSARIRSLNDPDLLKGLHRAALKCHSVQEFETILQQVPQLLRVPA